MSGYVPIKLYLENKKKWIESRNAGQFALQQLFADLKVIMVQYLGWVEQAVLFGTKWQSYRNKDEIYLGCFASLLLYLFP